MRASPLLLRSEPGLVPVGAATGAGDAAELLARERPDVVMLEPGLLDGDGIALCRRLTAEPGGPRVILYTAAPGEEIELLARVAGASALVDKAAAPGELFEIIRRVGPRRHVAAAAHARGAGRGRAPASTPTTSPSWPCSWTARRRPTSPPRCGWACGPACAGSSG